MFIIRGAIMNKKNNLLNRIYEHNPKNGNYIIEVSLSKFTDIFNEWDHAPVKRRDIDPELVYFLNSSSQEIPLKYNLDICFYLDEIQGKDKEELIISWLKIYYSFAIQLETLKLRDLNNKAAIYMLISFFLLSFSFWGNGYTNNIFISTLTQIVIVGGWVLLWEAISSFTFKRIDRLQFIKSYKRFVNATVYFKYQNIDKIDDIKDDEIMTMSQVATYFKISEDIINTLVKEGVMPAFKIGEHWRIKKNDIVSFIETLKQSNRV